MSNGLIVFDSNLKGVKLRREMVKNRAILDALEPVERSIIVSSCDAPIEGFDQIARMNELRKVLTGVLRDTGCKSPDETDFRYMIVRLSEITKEYYGELTWREFRLAFTMAIAGQLDDYLPKRSDGTADRGHYQNFSIEYVCKILGAYKARRGYVIRKANGMVVRPQVSGDPEAAKLYRNNAVAGLFETFEKYCETGRIDGVSPVAEVIYYKLLSDAGLAPKFEVTEAERREVFNRVINHLAKSGQVAERRRMEEEGPGAEELQGRAIGVARRKALVAAFEQMRGAGIKLGDYIKFV